MFTASAERASGGGAVAITRDGCRAAPDLRGVCIGRRPRPGESVSDARGRLNALAAGKRATVKPGTPKREHRARDAPKSFSRERGKNAVKEYSFKYVSAVFNDRIGAAESPAFLSDGGPENALRVHRALPEYAPTPLVPLNGLARRLGLKAVFVKDESRRFGLNAFKGLGGLYALFRLVCRETGLDARTAVFDDLASPATRDRLCAMTFVTATDGNHGRGVAWAASRLGCGARVLMPAGSSAARAEAIRSFGAECRVTDFGYDDTVRLAAALARENGWFLVQDTSWPGYTDVPAWIAQGYATMAEEAASRMERLGVPPPSHVFLQAGVGAMAGGVAGYLARRWRERPPVFAVVEPENMACLYRSARIDDGKPHAAVGTGPTIMAGLNCGEPCPLTWPVLRERCSWFVKCADFVAANGMRLLAAPFPGDARVISGESGAVTAGLLYEICSRPELSALREKMGLDADSSVLLFSTEGDTDPRSWENIVHRGARASPGE